MKLNFTLIAVSLFIVSQLPAQVGPGQKTFTGSINVTYSDGSVQDRLPGGSAKSTATFFSLSAEVLYGKISRSNLLFAYGVQLESGDYRTYSDGRLMVKNKYTRVYPTIMFQRRITISERLSYIPGARLRLHYRNKNNETAYTAIARFEPIALSFALGKRVSMQLAAGALNISNAHYRYKVTGYANKQNVFQLQSNYNSWTSSVQVML